MTEQKGKPRKEEWTAMFDLSFDEELLSFFTGIPRCEKTKAMILVALRN
jgi:hypothetical protein